MSNWQCGDCNCTWGSEVKSCPHLFDDYLGVRDVKTIEEAMAKHLAPVFAKFDKPKYVVFEHGSPYYRAFTIFAA